MRIRDWSADVCSSYLVFDSTTHGGLTQALVLMRKLIATAALTFSCLCSASPVTSLKADPAIYRVTLAHIEAEFCKAPPLTAEDKASLVSAATAVTVPGLVFDHVITPMDYAVIADDVPSIIRLVGIGYPLTSRSLSTGGSLLHLAAWSDSRSVALFLLQQGADPNDSSGTGAPPHMVAARTAERRVGKECVSKCSSGWSPLH